MVGDAANDAAPQPARHARAAAAAWILIFLVALGLRTGVAILHPPAMDGDQRLYTMLAERLAGNEGYLQGGAPKTTVHPLLVTLHAAVIRMGAEPRAAGIGLVLLIGSLMPVAGGLAVGSILGRSHGLAAAALLALHPHYVVRSASIEPDLLAALLGFWVAGALWRRRLWLAGALLGLAYLNRPEAVFLFPPAAWVAWRRGSGARGLARMTVPFLALSAVFVLYVHGATGRWALSGKDHWQYLLGVHQYRSGDRPLPPESIPSLRESVPSITGHLRSQPREALLGYGYRWGLLIRGLLRQSLLLLAPLALVGIVHAWRRSRDGLVTLCLPLVLLPVYPVVGVFFRHSLVVGPLLVALSGVGLVALLDGPRRRGRVLRWGAYAAYLAAVVAGGLVVLELGLRAAYGNRKEPIDPGPYRREPQAWSGLPPEFRIERFRQPGARFTATSTLYGCRHPGPVESVVLEQGKIETLFLGDSFTFGWGVADGETFGAVYGLRSGGLTRTLVCGGYGRGTGYHLEQLRRVLAAEPHVRQVIYQVFGNDLTRRDAPTNRRAGVRRGLHRLLPMTMAYVAGPLAARVTRSLPPEGTDDAVRRLFPDYGPILREDRLPPILVRRREEAYDRFDEDLRELVELAHRHGAEVAVVVMPYAFRFEPEAARPLGIDGLHDDASYRLYLERVRRSVEAGGARWIDLEPFFRAARERAPGTRLFLPGDLHLSAEGNRLVADALRTPLAGASGTAGGPADPDPRPAPPDG